MKGVTQLRDVVYIVIVGFPAIKFKEPHDTGTDNNMDIVALLHMIDNLQNALTNNPLLLDYETSDYVYITET